MSWHDDTTGRIGSNKNHVRALLSFEGHAQPLQDFTDILTGQIARQLRSIAHV
jgi:hypothetical protein